jgi:hypothetical protein
VVKLPLSAKGQIYRFAVFAQNHAVLVSEGVRKITLSFRCFRLGKFLEARIIPERIEHRIEPEPRRSQRHT